jgi:transmembrane sensor
METPSDALLARYVAGECTPAEAREVEQWCRASPVHQARLDTLHAIWNARRTPRSWDLEGIWGGVRRTMRADARRAPAFGHHLQGEPERPWLAAPLGAAAVLLLLAGATLAILKARRVPPPMREYATSRGQRGTLQLPDGSRLLLAPQSRLRVPADFGRGARELSLDGEALFTVAHDSTRPFRVRVKGAVVEDIETRFDLRAYPEDSLVAVAVAEGAVVLGRGGLPAGTARPDGRSAAEGIVVRLGEIATLAPDGAVTTARGAAVADYLAWADGRLHFASVPLQEVLRSIGRWYDLDVRVEGPALATRSITAEFSLRSATEMLQALALAVDARLTRAGRIVTLRLKS